MRHSSPSLPRFLLAAASDRSIASTAMSSRPQFSRGRGRGQGRRNFSDQADPNFDHRHFVTGDSHFRSVRDTNRGFRPPSRPQHYGPQPQLPRFNNVYNNTNNGPRYNAVPPPPQYFSNNNNNQQQQFYGPPPQLRGPPPRQFYQNQHFQPRQEQFRPRNYPQIKPADYREWEYAKPGPPPNCETFKVLSYNILADYLAINHRSKLYIHIPHHIMDWERRKRSIIFELKLWSADILCFQEVDRFNELEDELKRLGYSGIWKMRTGDPVDGCAVFWRVSRCKLLHEESIEFSKLGLRDNVAQICVFELMDQQKSEHRLPSSHTDSKKVVVCNIHVLFNPKRGEIKLGQIRVLLHKAHAVSKLWNDAPIVVCGDFNCLPKSPLYNFIAEQKLDVSELARHKVSGQASAEIRQARPQSAHNSNPIGIPGVVTNKNVEATVSPSDEKQQESPSTRVDKVSVAGNFSPSQASGVIESTESSIIEEGIDENINESPSKVRDPVLVGCRKGMNSSVCVPLSNTTDSESYVSFVKDSSHELVSAESNNNASAELTRSKHFVGECFSSSATLISPYTGSSQPDTRALLESHFDVDKASPVGDNCSGNDSSYHGSAETTNSEVSGDILTLSAASSEKRTTDSCIVDGSCESINIDSELGEKIERLSLSEEDVMVGEDCDTFLSDLHNSAGVIPPDLNKVEISDYEESNGPSKEYYGQSLNPYEDGFLDDTNGKDSEVAGMEQSTYDPSTWTPAEIETATGRADCTALQHPLKLRSVYAEVEDSSGTRDPNGEPLVTSYHRCFLGTVDYIWRSEGLQTARVLAPIQKHAMQWTRGFPTKKWGSDHIALVAELAITKNDSDQNTTG